MIRDVDSSAGAGALACHDMKSLSACIWTREVLGHIPGQANINKQTEGGVCLYMEASRQSSHHKQQPLALTSSPKLILQILNLTWKLRDFLTHDLTFLCFITPPMKPDSQELFPSVLFPLGPSPGTQCIANTGK